MTYSAFDENMKSLAEQFPTLPDVRNEIINLEAVLRLPKGTEHFMSDIHGEYEAFTHILHNASGVIREKVDEVLGESTTEDERTILSTLIYYPREKLAELIAAGSVNREWYRVTLQRLVEVCHFVASKSTRNYVRKSLPAGYGKIIDELLQAQFHEENKTPYYEQLVEGIIATGAAGDYIAALAQLIKQLAVCKLHIVGDVFDRGPRPDIIMDALVGHYSVDIQWGNHDVLWMAAACGSPLAIATVLNVSVKYNNLEVLEQGYGISLAPLDAFARQVYAHTDCKAFRPKLVNKESYDPEQVEQAGRMYKAITMVMFKLECQAIARNPDFAMGERCLLPRVNYADKTVDIAGVSWPMKDCDFPTVDPANPTALTAEEQAMMDALCAGFTSSKKLAAHLAFLYEKGGVYKIENRALLFHGAVPLDGDGSFSRATFAEGTFSGRALFDFCDAMARAAYTAPAGTAERTRGLDMLWYMWCGPKSPVFGRDRMTTFERVFIADKNTYTERKNDYYRYTDSETVARAVLEEFGLDPAQSHIVNGHVPIKASRGENPIKAGGRVIMIDGGFSKAYQSTTGIAGYTLVYTSRGLSLRSHQPFQSVEAAVKNNSDIVSTVYVFEHHKERLRIRDTDEGEDIQRQLAGLYRLLNAYETGEAK